MLLGIAKILWTNGIQSDNPAKAGQLWPVITAKSLKRLKKMPSMKVINEINFTMNSMIERI